METNPVAFGLKVIGGVVAFLISLTVIFGSWFTIAENQRGLLLRNGAFSAVVQPGLGFKLPWVDSIVRVDLQTFTYHYDKMEAYSADQQPAMLKVSVTLHIMPDRVRDFYFQHSADYDAAVRRIVATAVQQQTKIVFGQYNAATAISKRAQLNMDVQSAVERGAAAALGPR
jgi:regulator of protease activity HflC (stomatin/prohibitin superfamily)